MTNQRALFTKWFFSVKLTRKRVHGYTNWWWGEAHPIASPTAQDIRNQRLSMAKQRAAMSSSPTGGVCDHTPSSGTPPAPVVWHEHGSTRVWPRGHTLGVVEPPSIASACTAAAAGGSHTPVTPLTMVAIVSAASASDDAGLLREQRRHRSGTRVGEADTKHGAMQATAPGRAIAMV